LAEGNDRGHLSPDSSPRRDPFLSRNRESNSRVWQNRRFPAPSSANGRLLHSARPSTPRSLATSSRSRITMSERKGSFLTPPSRFPTVVLVPRQSISSLLQLEVRHEGRACSVDSVHRHPVAFAGRLRRLPVVDELSGRRVVSKGCAARCRRLDLVH